MAAPLFDSAAPAASPLAVIKTTPRNHQTNSKSWDFVIESLASNSYYCIRSNLRPLLFQLSETLKGASFCTPKDVTQITFCLFF